MKLKQLNLKEVDLTKYELIPDIMSEFTKNDNKFYFKEIVGNKVHIYDSGFWTMGVDYSDFLELNLGKELDRPLKEMLKESKINSIVILISNINKQLETINEYLEEIKG